MAPGAADSVSNNLTQDCFFFDEKCSLASDENIIRSASSVRDRLFDPFVPHVLGIGTANPDRIVTKEDLFRDYVPILDSPKLRVIATGIIKNCGISQRHVGIGHEVIKNMPSIMKFGEPSLNERMALFESTGIDLGKNAAEKALAEWGGNREEITHIITYSNSGIPCPGLDIRLIKALGLNPSTKHMFVSYMGCHMGLLGLRLAGEIAQANPNHRVLIVTSEVNSANIQSPDSEDPLNNIIADIIFGDGAAAIVVGSSLKEFERGIFEIHRSKTIFIPNTEDVIMAQIATYGLHVGLKKTLPGLVKDNVDEFVRSFVGPEVKYNDMIWAVHPGGKAILDAVESACKLPSEKLSSSRYVLDKFSNMASPTVLFVLDKIRKDNASISDKWTLTLGFGPGVSVEGIMLRLVH